MVEFIKLTDNWCGKAFYLNINHIGAIWSDDDGITYIDTVRGNHVRSYPVKESVNDVLTLIREVQNDK